MHSLPKGVSDNSTCKINKNSNISINVGIEKKDFFKLVFFVAVRYFEHKALPQISDKHCLTFKAINSHPQLRR